MSCRYISVNDVAKLCHDQSATIVDIREPLEYQREHIEDAINIPIENLTKESLGESAPECVIFHCLSGHRTRASQAIFEALGIKDPCILEGGIDAWKGAGKPTICNKKIPISIMRQVQIVIGFMVVLGVVLGLTLSPYFALISGFFGLGLLFAGITGTCGLAKLLALFPYNRCSNEEKQK
jgi:rhodanese-related sulfurtransferase